MDLIDLVAVVVIEVVALVFGFLLLYVSVELKRFAKFFV
jgi:hypothetical protein